MSETGNIITHSLAQNPVQHVVSASTVSAGVTGKIISDPESISAWDSAVSLSSDLAIFAGLFLTCFLIFRAYRADQIDRATLRKLNIDIAESGRRKSDRSNPPSDN